MAALFAPDSTTYATQEAKFYADGKVYRQAIAHGTLTALTPYKYIFNEYGPVTAALADETKYYRVIVPLAAVSSGALFWGQTGGYIESMVTPSITTAVGYGLEVHDGAVASTGADYLGTDAEFAVATEASTAASHTVMLVDRVILSST